MAPGLAAFTSARRSLPSSTVLLRYLSRNKTLYTIKQFPTTSLAQCVTMHYSAFDTLSWFPFVLFNAISFPAYQVFKFPSEFFSVQDVFYFVSFDSVVDYGWGWVLLNTFRDSICVVRS